MPTAIGNHVGHAGVSTGPKVGHAHGKANCHAALDKLDSAAEEAAAAHDTMFAAVRAVWCRGSRELIWVTATAPTRPPTRLSPAAADLIGFFEGLGYATSRGGLPGDW